MFIELDRGTGPRQHLGETVFAVDHFVIPQIVAVQFDQVKRDQGDVIIVTTGAQGIEIGSAIIAANDDLAIDQEEWRPKAAGGLHDGRKPIGPIVAASGP